MALLRARAGVEAARSRRAARGAARSTLAAIARSKNGAQAHTARVKMTSAVETTACNAPDLLKPALCALPTVPCSATAEVLLFWLVAQRWAPAPYSTTESEKRETTNTTKLDTPSTPHTTHPDAHSPS